jgi:hypothetical protein
MQENGLCGWVMCVGSVDVRWRLYGNGHGGSAQPPGAPWHGVLPRPSGRLVCCPPHVLQEGFFFGREGCKWDPALRDGKGACVVAGCECERMRAALRWPPSLPMAKLNVANYPLKSGQSRLLIQHYSDLDFARHEHEGCVLRCMAQAGWCLDGARRPSLHALAVQT